MVITSQLPYNSRQIFYLLFYNASNPGILQCFQYFVSFVLKFHVNKDVTLTYYRLKYADGDIR